MRENPYSAPSSDVEIHAAPEGLALHDPRSVGAARGVGWISDGFGHFRQAPGAWLGICVVGFVIMIVLTLIPFVGVLNNLLTYVWIGGLMIGCKAQDDGQPIELGHLFAGFRSKFGSLLLLGVTAMLVGFVVMLVALGPLYAELFSASLSGEPAALDRMASELTAGVLLRVLVALLFMIPLTMAIWFAPMLIALNDLTLFEAIRLSFSGCLKNLAPFLLYSILASVLAFVAALPLALGYLVFMPTMFGAMYRAYKDIYIAT